MAPPRAMNTSQAQVIDPILSTQARGYRNAEFIGARILPYADIPNRSMKVIRFGKDSFRRYMDTRRAPGGERKRITFGYDHIHHPSIDIPFKLPPASSSLCANVPHAGQGHQGLTRRTPATRACDTRSQLRYQSVDQACRRKAKSQAGAADRRQSTALSLQMRPALQCCCLRADAGCVERGRRRRSFTGQSRLPGLQSSRPIHLGTPQTRASPGCETLCTVHL